MTTRIPSKTKIMRGRAARKQFVDTVKGGAWLAGQKAKEVGQKVATGAAVGGVVKPIVDTMKKAGQEFKYLSSGQADAIRPVKPTTDALNLKSKGMNMAAPSSFKKGGKVKKTGMAKVHKGERVLTKTAEQKYEDMRRKVFGLGKKRK